jgi:hypothetical protein
MDLNMMSYQMIQYLASIARSRGATEIGPLIVKLGI